MAAGCTCKIVGSYSPINIDDRIISISMNSSTESSLVVDPANPLNPQILEGPTTGTVNISAYASDDFHSGCVGQASVNIKWLRKYDCDTDTVHLLFSGQGDSNYSGNVDTSTISLNHDIKNYTVINANASSGPSSIYEQDLQYDGYGLRYSGGPWTFDTSDEDTLIMSPEIGLDSILYLQGFNIKYEPNKIPIATYTFIYTNEAATS